MTSAARVQNSVPANQRTLPPLDPNLIGLGVGATFLCTIRDWYRTAHPDNPLQPAFYSLVPFYLLAICLFLLLARALGKAEPSVALADKVR